MRVCHTHGTLSSFTVPGVGRVPPLHGAGACHPSKVPPMVLASITAVAPAMRFSVHLVQSYMCQVLQIKLSSHWTSGATKAFSSVTCHCALQVWHDKDLPTNSWCAVSSVRSVTQPTSHPCMLQHEPYARLQNSRTTNCWGPARSRHWWSPLASVNYVSSTVTPSCQTVPHTLACLCEWHFAPAPFPAP
jgi:hypothetical protein